MINFAIVGCGHIARKHVDALKQIKDGQLVAVCDTVEERMEPFQNEDPSIKCYTDFDELLKNDNIDVVSVCTPSGFHADLTIKAAESKKHVVVEKPIALTLEDADAMIDSCKKNNVKLSVVHPNRFRAGFAKVKGLMENGEFGKISHANATVRWNRNQEYYNQAPWRGTKKYDGGVLMNQAIHNLDILLWTVGEIDEVFSYDATRLRDIEAEDVSIGVAKFSDGALGVIEAATTVYPKNYEESLAIFGEKGTIKIGGPNALYIQHAKFENISDEEVNTMIEQIQENPFGIPGHQGILEDMVNAIQKDELPIVTGEDGKRALQLVVSLNESAELKQPVKTTK